MIRVSTLLATVLLVWSGAPASALTIDLGVGGPVAAPGVANILFTAGSLTATATASGTGTLVTQSVARGLGATNGTGQALLQSGEGVTLSFSSSIQLTGFVVWFQNAGADPFTLEVGGTTLIQGTDFSLSSASGDFFTYSVSGLPSGSTVSLTGGGSFAGRFKSVEVVPEPATALLVGLGLVGLGGARRRLR